MIGMGTCGESMASRSSCSLVCKMKSLPCCERSATGMLSSARIDRARLPYWSEATRWPDSRSLILRNSAMVPSTPVQIDKAPMTLGAIACQSSGSDDVLRDALPHNVLNTMIGMEKRLFDFESAM